MGESFLECIHIKRWWAGVLSLALVALVAVTFSLERWQSFVANPWIAPSSDHSTLSSMYLKGQNPQLFTRDYIFNQERYLSFYTPSFTLLVNSAGGGTEDYPTAVASLWLPVALLYALAFALLLWQVTQSWAVAVLVTIMALYLEQVMLIENWSLYRWPLPRTMAMPAVVAAVFSFWRALSLEKPAWGWWISGGLLVGLSMNLHPTTGLALALALGLVALAHLVQRGLGQFPAILLWGLSVVLAASPILVNLVGQSPSIVGQVPLDFQTTTQLFIERVGWGMIPTNPTYFNLVLQAEAQIVLGAVWLALSLVLWWRMRLGGVRAAVLLFALLQMIFLWLVMPSVGLEALLILLAGITWLWLRNPRPQTLMLLSETSAAMILVAWPLPMILYPLWQGLEIRSLSMFVAELSRGARLLVIPLYAMVALILAQLLNAGLAWGQRRQVGLRQPAWAWASLALLLVMLNGVRVMSWPVVDERHNAQAAPPLVQLALWAKDNTPSDAVVAYASTQSLPFAMSQFRYYAQRAVSHSNKDLSMVAYSHIEDLPALYERQRHIVALSATPQGTLQLMEELEADYIVINYDEVPFEAAPPQLEELLRVGSFALYQHRSEADS